jgi:hypothetical protein
MNTNPEYRNSRRFHHQAPVMLKHGCTGYCYSGTMYDDGDSGMYFESDYAPRLDTKIQIRIDNLPFVSAPHGYFVKVIWRKQLADDDSPYSYRIGVKYC